MISSGRKDFDSPRAELRRHTPLDRLLIGADTLLGLARGRQPPGTGRPSPAVSEPSIALDPAARRAVIRMMRVNHAGEVSAQALYLGQAMVARQPATAALLRSAAREEIDHLQWCAERLAELDARPSRLDPFWFTGSLLTGMVSGLAGDRWSMAFLEETERQVIEHLQGHLRRLPEGDRRTRAILAQMAIDEAQHAGTAVRHGSRRMPRLLKRLMRAQARVMTTIAQHL